MWFKVDDGFFRHDKTRKAARLCPPSIGLWVIAGSECATAADEGHVSADMLLNSGEDAGLTPAMTGKAAAALVAVGLWHDAKTIRRCETCMAAVDGKLQRGTHYFHDWLEYQFTRDESKIPEVRWKKARAKALHRDHRLKDMILERDRERCRYCRVRVDFRDRVGETGGTYDHVDPGQRENTYENVVVACRGCNTRKRDRTPEEAGMVLLDPPEDLAPASPGADPGLVGTRFGPTHAHAAHATRDGAGRDLAPASPGPSLATNGHSSNGASHD